METIKDALGNISDETIEKIFAENVGVFAHTVEQAFWQKSFFRPIKAYHLDGSDISEAIAGVFGF